MTEWITAVASLLWPLAILASVYRVASVAKFALTPVDLGDEVAKWSIEVPDDIVAHAMVESEEWAREDILRLAREKYFDHGNWNTVRRAFGLAARD